MRDYSLFHRGLVAIITEMHRSYSETTKAKERRKKEEGKREWEGATRNEESKEKQGKERKEKRS